MNAKHIIRQKHRKTLRETFSKPRISKREIISILKVLGVDDVPLLKTRDLLRLLTTTLSKNVPRKYLGDVWVGIHPDDPSLMVIGRPDTTGKAFSTDKGLLEHLLDYRAKEKEERESREVLEEELKQLSERVKELEELVEKEREKREEVENDKGKIEISWMESELENDKLMNKLVHLLQ